MWVYEKDNKLLYFISNNFTYRQNIALLSFNHTLIEDKVSKEKIPFMQLYNETVVQFLEQMNEHGSIIIVENMIKMSIETLKLSIGKFFTLLENEKRCISFMILFPLENNKFKKPYTHIFKKIQELYLSKNPHLNNLENCIDLDKSIIIGNNAGRLSTSIFKCDESDCDRAFANNINIKNFRTPSQIFLHDSTIRQWQWKSKIVIEDILLKQKSLIEPSFNNILYGNSQNNAQHKTFIIFIAGPPTSGKSILGNRVKMHLQDDNRNGKPTEILNINNFNTHIQMIDIFLKKITENLVNVIVIDTLESDKKRNLYFSAIESININLQKSIKYIEMGTDRQICEFLNIFRLQITKSANNLVLYNKYVYTNYYAHYTTPVFKKIDIKYTKYPMILRRRDALFYHY